MAGMGPAPKPDHQRRRRNPTVAMVQLPAEGRHGETPKWPLYDDVRLTARRNLLRAEVKRILRELDECDDGRRRNTFNRDLGRAQAELAELTEQLRLQRRMEHAVWAELWTTPQSVAWERLRWTREVATYVRHKVMGELGDLDAAKEARQWSDRLGLTPLAMLRLRWQIVSDEVGPRREERRQEETARPAAPVDPLAALRAV